MRWHKDNRVDDDILRHPADVQTWKDFDAAHNWFASDPRNVRLELLSDGFNPFGNMSTSYSMWPVVLTPYNLPPWYCMKESFLFLTVLIPGKKSPGKNIHVYLEPVIESLNELWNPGVKAYDAYSNETFQLHVALLWTINDFPAYGMLCGWSTKGRLACPVCNRETDYLRLQFGSKEFYLGHRRWLDKDHPWRRSRKFDGKSDFRARPQLLTGQQLLDQVTFALGSEQASSSRKRKRGASNPSLNWKTKAAFWGLPYWTSIALRHNLDVMHVEKNISENLLGTLMNIEGKTKYDMTVTLDLKNMGIRKELHIDRTGAKPCLPQACYSLSVSKQREVCEWLKTIKFPDAYASNISRCIISDGRSVTGMKSHDYHVFI
ncbi:unnamed protein product [Linum trigynum]|uniref:Transposase n=1 Tax=Linum trigynum TaxID=586398 RepID=A0AAV2FNM9_9ROSI